jgi:hypothetical protein
MRFVEELDCGDCFDINNEFYIVTTDFKKNNDRLCVSLANGSSRWLSGNTLVDTISIYRLDKENNIIPFKETQKNDITQNTNIS